MSWAERGLTDGEEGGSQELALGGELVAVGPGDFLDDAMGAEQAQLTADLGGEAAGVEGRRRAGGARRRRRSRLRKPAVALAQSVLQRLAFRHQRVTRTPQRIARLRVRRVVRREPVDVFAHQVPAARAKHRQRLLLRARFRWVRVRCEHAEEQ
jgi:hypothetical protein